MKILILSQSENLYLPNAMSRVCRDHQDKMACVVVAPAMSTHGGPIKGFLRHFRLFGLVGTLHMGCRVLAAKLRAPFSHPGPEGPFYSLKGMARTFDIPYHEVTKIKGQEFADLIEQYKPDLLISMSCPQIIGKKVRALFPKGCINVHGAPLPKYRGLMPAFWVLCHVETSTASTVHDLAAKLDDGQILLQREVPITPEDTWDSLVRKTKAAGGEILSEAISHIEAGTETRRPNLEEEATYFSFPTAEDRKKFRAAGRRFL